MTPQQAIELLRAALKKISETRFGWDGDCGVTSIAEEALDATADCAPAPTEPAVDRDAFMCAALAFAKAHIDSDELERIDDMNPTDESWSAVLVSHDDYNATKAALLACYRALATSASPAVPEQSLAVASGQTALDLEAVTRAWMTARGYGNVTPLHAMCDLQARVEKLQGVPAPAPLAPSEPIAWFEADTSAKGLPLRDVIGGMVHSTRFHSTKPEVLNNPLWPLYEHPAPQLPQASQPTSTPEAVNLLVEEAKRVMGQDGGAEGGGHYIPKPPPPRPQRPIGPTWTDAEREEYRKNMKRGERCPECSVIEGGGHFSGCPRGK